MTTAGGGQITFATAPYLGGQFADAPAPPVAPDVPHPPMGSLDAAYNALVSAANSDDGENDGDVAEQQGDRADQYGDILGKFPANDEQSQQMLTQMSQAVPQALTGIMGGLTGMLGGLAAIPQSMAQAGTQAMQTMLTSATSAAGDDGEWDDDEDAGFDDAFGDGDFGSGGGGGDGEGGGGGAGGEGTTLPATYLAPPQLPAAATFPAAAAPAITPAPAATPAAQTGMGMPMMPMAPGMGGAAAGGDKNQVTKKVQPPTIANAKPVVGRFVADRLDAPVVNRVRLGPKSAATAQNSATAKDKEAKTT